MLARLRIQQEAYQPDPSGGGCFDNGSTSRILYLDFEPHAGEHCPRYCSAGFYFTVAALLRATAAAAAGHDMTCHAMHLLGPSLRTASTSLVVDSAGSSYSDHLLPSSCSL